MIKDIFCVRVYENIGAGKIEDMGWLLREANGDGGNRYAWLSAFDDWGATANFDTKAEADAAGEAFVAKMNADAHFVPFLYSVEYKVVV